eukprot:scaffold7561_cov227-Skeletonema_dohrnii-CCMP3373.AAC.6
MTSDDNNPSSYTGGDHQLLLSSSTGRLFDMNSSAPPAPEPETGSRNEIPLADDDDTAEVVSADEVAIILGFLSHVDIMRARVCTTWRDAAKKTLVPLTGFKVNSVRSFNAMRVMATALPNLQDIKIYSLVRGHIYASGEDPDERLARYHANDISHDINILSNFTKLRSLEISWTSVYTLLLNGRYPVLFNFPLLRILRICARHMKWDLEMLSAFPVLKELDLLSNPQLTGNLSSLRTLKDTLEKVTIEGCQRVHGNYMDLADFPRLKVLDLSETAVTVDIRDIREHSFPGLESLCLPSSVSGGSDYQFQSISDVPSFMHTIHVLLQRTPTLFEENDYDLSDAFGWSLSEDSPDMYDREIGSPFPPFVLRFIQAGSRLGWSWCSYDDEDYDYEYGCQCEINWLDPEPSSESDDYEAYIEEVKHFERGRDFYRGYNEPPTEMEYRRLCEDRETN